MSTPAKDSELKATEAPAPALPVPEPFEEDDEFEEFDDETWGADKMDKADAAEWAPDWDDDDVETDFDKQLRAELKKTADSMAATAATSK